MIAASLQLCREEAAAGRTAATPEAPQAGQQASPDLEKSAAEELEAILGPELESLEDTPEELKLEEGLAAEVSRCPPLPIPSHMTQWKGVNHKSVTLKEG